MVKPEQGGEPPLNAEGKTLLMERIAARRAGKSQDGVEVCLPPGIPRVMWQDRPFLFMVTPAKAYIVHEYQHTLRHIYLGETLPPADERDVLFHGQSVGRWDGDVLTVETGGFNDKTWIDAGGLPQSAEAVVTEKYRLLDDGTMENRVTINDPKYYTAPWTARVLFRRAPQGTRIKEDICAEKLMDPQLRATILKDHGQK